MEEMVDTTETGYIRHWATDFPCSGSRADLFHPLPSPFLGSPSSTGSEALQCSRQTLAKVPPSPGEGPSHCTNSSGLCFQNSKAALVLKISSEKQTGFVPFHPVEAHKKISTLYKEQQWYNLNMHPATNHIYRENRPIQTEQDHFITLEFRWSFWRMADKENQTEGGGCCFWK